MSYRQRLQLLRRREVAIRLRSRLDRSGSSLQRAPVQLHSRALPMCPCAVTIETDLEGAFAARFERHARPSHMGPVHLHNRTSFGSLVVHCVI